MPDHPRTSPPPVAVLFTQHLVGLGGRKGSMSYWAEALATLGWETRVVTTQLSYLSVLTGNPRLRAVPRARRNRWCDTGARLWSYVWVPPIHPASLRSAMLDGLLRPFYPLYPRLLPAEVRHEVARAALIVVDSGAGIMLLDRLRALAPGARIVYAATDRMAAVGFHPDLIAMERRNAPRFDLVRVAGRAQLADFAPGVRAAYIPQGLDKGAFDRATVPPYDGGGRHAVIAGDMQFDGSAVAAMAGAEPSLTFHLFGRMPLERLSGLPNLRVHGEVSHETLAPFIKFADVGIAPYGPRPDLDYLVDSSLKLIQYRYCRLPVVTPELMAAGRPGLFGYRPGAPDSAVAALRRALAAPRLEPDQAVPSWTEAMEQVLDRVGLRDAA